MIEAPGFESPPARLYIISYSFSRPLDQEDSPFSNLSFVSRLTAPGRLDFSLLPRGKLAPEDGPKRDVFQRMGKLRAILVVGVLAYAGPSHAVVLETDGNFSVLPADQKLAGLAKKEDEK